MIIAEPQMIRLLVCWFRFIGIGIGIGIEIDSDPDPDQIAKKIGKRNFMYAGCRGLKNSPELLAEPDTE
ncbi:MAG: hypothetical protein ACLFUY_00475 [Desulfobacterales bacterium]